MALSKWTPFRSNQVGEIEQRRSSRSLSSCRSAEENVEANVEANVVIPEMGWMRKFCYRDGSTQSGTRYQLLRMLLILMVPIIILLMITAQLFGYTLIGFIVATRARSSLRLSTELGSVTHSLQRERDYSALHLSSMGPDSKTMLLKLYAKTDISIYKLSAWPVKDENIRDEYESRDRFHNYLNKHRYTLDSLEDNTIEGEVEFYTKTITRIIKWISMAITRSRSGLVWKSLVAYQDIIIAKENVGQVRSIGSVYYNNGGFPSSSCFNSLLESQDVANTSVESARRYSNIVLRTLETLYTNNLTLKRDVESYRYELRRDYTHSNGTRRVEDTARRFFDTMSAYLDILLVIQTELLEKILLILDERSDYDIRKMVVIGCVSGFVLLACPMVVKSMHDLTKEMHMFSGALISRSQMLAEEKERIDRLLYQLLPKAIAQRMKREVVIKPENFAHVTLFFSDIVGFTKMSSRSSPMNVVKMLNNLYTAFDQRIMKYDAYKVETIGDAYLVASGLPKRNGNRHASEIAKLALDMCDCIQGVEIEHMPGARFRLRIGCHSGPLATGVVGTKMPRYGLFGETVNIASKMESLGIAGRIHITQSMRDFLAMIGGFDITRREDRTIKPSGHLLKAFGGSTRTYWLNGHESMPDIPIPKTPVNSGTVLQQEQYFSIDESDFFNGPFHQTGCDTEPEFA